MWHCLLALSRQLIFQASCGSCIDSPIGVLLQGIKVTTTLLCFINRLTAQHILYILREKSQVESYKEYSENSCVNKSHFSSKRKIHHEGQPLNRPYKHFPLLDGRIVNGAIFKEFQLLILPSLYNFMHSSASLA